MTAPGFELSDERLVEIDDEAHIGVLPYRTELQQIVADLQRHRAAAKAVEALHEPVQYGQLGYPQWVECRKCAEQYPCLDLKALRGEA